MSTRNRLLHFQPIKGSRGRLVRKIIKAIPIRIDRFKFPDLGLGNIERIILLRVVAVVSDQPLARLVRGIHHRCLSLAALWNNGKVAHGGIRPDPESRWPYWLLWLSPTLLV